MFLAVLTNDAISRAASLHSYLLFVINNIEVRYDPKATAFTVHRPGKRLTGLAAWRFLTALNGLDDDESKQLLLHFPWQELLEALTSEKWGHKPSETY